MSRELTKLTSSLKDVPLSQMRVAESAQRELREHRVTELAESFDPEFFGHPVVNLRDGHFWIVDGQHRIEALKRWLGDWKKQVVTCRVYTGLSLKQEAGMYLRLNNQLAQSSFDKFKVGVSAGLPLETSVRRAVEAAGLKISPKALGQRDEGMVTAVATLCKIHKRSDAQTLTRALQLTYEAFGTPGLANAVIDGMARVCERYNGTIKDKDVVERLTSMRGGVGALVTRAASYRKQTGNAQGYCVAASIVDLLNAGKHGRARLPSWWKEE